MDGESINSQILLQANISLLLPVFEQFLDMAPDTSAHDTIRQSVIILMGCLARHLDKDDPKVSSLITPLLNISDPFLAETVEYWSTLNLKISPPPRFG